MSERGTSQLESLLDPRDREYVESLTDPEKRETIVSTILRYQETDRLEAGDPVPPLELFRVENGDPVRLDELVGKQPLLLVFGSYT